MVYIPFHNIFSVRALEEIKTNKFITYGVGQTTHVEGSNMVGRILSRNTIEIWDV